MRATECAVAVEDAGACCQAESMSPRHVLLGVLVAVIWGVNFVAIGVGLQDSPPLILLALRFVFVALPLVFFVRRPDASWWAIAGVGIFMSVGQFGLLYTAMALGLPAGLAAVILQCQAAFTMAIAFLALRERPSPIQIGGAAVALVGLAVVAVGRMDGTVELGVVVPVLVCAAGGLSWAIGNVIARTAPRANGFGMVVWSAIFVPLPVMLISLAVDGPAVIGEAFSTIGWQTVASLAYTVVLASLVGYTVWNSLLRIYPAARVAVFPLLAPPVAIVTALIAFGEFPNWLEIVGSVLLIGGVALGLIRRRARSIPGAEAPVGSPTGR